MKRSPTLRAAITARLWHAGYRAGRDFRVNVYIRDAAALVEPRRHNPEPLFAVLAQSYTLTRCPHGAFVERQARP